MGKIKSVSAAPPCGIVRHLALSALVVIPSLLWSAPRVDLSMPGRPESAAKGWSAWFFEPGKNDSLRVGEITFQLTGTQAPGKPLKAVWWKGSIATAKVVTDGVTAESAAGDSGIELRLSGLSPGTHSLATYHNFSDGTDRDRFSEFDVFVDGQPVLRSVRPSWRALSDADGATAYITFEAKKDKPVSVTFRPSTGDRAATRKSVVLNAFALNVPDPAKQARKPVPENDDRHVAADRGEVILKWTPSGQAKAHRVFIGSTAGEVATPSTKEYRGEQSVAEFVLKDIAPDGEIFWRVDEVDTDGVVTPGEVWSFRRRQLAFPGAEGAGRFARGGRGGRVIEVTDLNDSGPGSLRAAVEAEGPRTVVFNVGGLITLESKLVVRNSNLTVAGQTAPGKGIAIRKYNFGMSGAEDSVIRFVRVRPGNIAGITLDGMGMQGSNHSIVDHASISWTIDEAFSSRSAENITLQRTLISEALNSAGHKNYKPGTQHGYAASIGGQVGSFHHNLLAHNSGRNWSLAGGINGLGRHSGALDLRNNVVYNWQTRATDGGAAKVNFVGNHYKPGPATKYLKFLNPQLEGVKAFGPQMYYVAGNVLEGIAGPENQFDGMTKPAPYAEFISAEPLFAAEVETQPARLAYKLVLSDVGCNQPELDEHDQRVIRETLTGTSSIQGSKTKLPGLPDSQEDVGGWENYPSVERPANWDTDHDGLPDWWETARGLNPNSAAGDTSESQRTPDASGFSELELYLAWMAAPHVISSGGNAVEVNLSALARGFTAKPEFTVSSLERGNAAVVWRDGECFVRLDGAATAPGFNHLTFTVADTDGDRMTRTVELFFNPVSRRGP